MLAHPAAERCGGETEPTGHFPVDPRDQRRRTSRATGEEVVSQFVKEREELLRLLFCCATKGGALKHSGGGDCSLQGSQGGLRGGTFASPHWKREKGEIKRGNPGKEKGVQHWLGSGEAFLTIPGEGTRNMRDKRREDYIRGGKKPGRTLTITSFNESVKKK